MYPHNVNESTEEQMKKWEEEAAEVGITAERRACQISMQKCDHRSRAVCVMLETHQVCLLNVWKGIYPPLSRLVGMLCQEHENFVIFIWLDEGKSGFYSCKMLLPSQKCSPTG